MSVLMKSGRWGWNTRAVIVVTTLYAVLAGLLVWGHGAPSAEARPPAPQSPDAPTQPFPDCGDRSSQDALWGFVKDVNPGTPAGHNQTVMWPNNDKSRGYAIHNGDAGAVPKKTYDWLLIPTSRQTGIECQDLLQDGAPEYFLDAYNVRNTYLPDGTDWALGINSADNRGHNQLHIHISRLKPQARADINKEVGKIATDQSKWKDSVITVAGHKFRAWNASTMTHNLFANLNNDIVSHIKGVQMGDQAMLVTSCAPKTCNGFIVLNSDEKSEATKPSGVNQIEVLLDKG